MPVFQLFSKRKKVADGDVPDVYQYEDLSQEFRTQIVHIWNDTITKGNYSADAYQEIVQILRREYGVFKLYRDTYDASDPRQAFPELANFFLTEQSIERCLDVVELTLRYIDIYVKEFEYASNPRARQLSTDAIEEFNTRAKEHGFGYQYIDGDLIRVDSELVHREAVVPALTVLRDRKFASAQEEFLKAHEHYRHGRMNEALIDALKAFESTMKIICDSRGWAYDKSKGASELVRACLDNNLIPAYWQNHFNGLKIVLVSAIPTPRNKQAGHGSGSTPAQTPPSELVSYVLHMTASTILFLSEADKKLP